MIFRAACATASAALQRQRGALLTFAPVFMGVGIGLFFSLAREPGLWGYGLALAGGLAALIVANALRHTLGPLFAAGPWIAFGFCVAGLHAHMSGGPVLDYRYYGVIEGRVVAIDRSFTDKIRLTLDRVYLERRQPYETPRRVRIALHAQDGLPLPAPGSHAILSGHLSPPPSPAEPRGFEFERHAWFQSLGAVGYTRSPALTFAPPESGPALVVFRLRMALSAAISARIGSDAGAVAAAVTTGDRSGMSRAILEDLRGANLAHLLAISGLHMGLLTGFVFGAVRFLLALIPHVALTWPTRRIAALAGLCAGAAYLALSGGSVATERAFIMVAVVFGAVLLGRRALTLRAVALAALIVLVLHPEALMGPGFQMSFAATTALVVAFRWLTQHDMFGAPRMIRPALAVLVSSAVAGAATAPFAAAHFNVVSHYGLLANLLSVPVMGALVMPAAVIAALAAPLGLEAAPLWVMEQGLRWILFVAQWVSSLEGAVGRLPSPPPAALPLFALGGLMLILWRGAARYGGGLALACAVFLWGTAERPDLLISPTGGLMGLMQAEGRALSKARGEAFVATSWLENDGDGAAQAEAHARAEGQVWALGDARFVHLTGKAAREATCEGKALLVLGARPDLPLLCPAITPDDLALTGALSFHLDGEKLTRLTAREVTGHRLWNDAATRARFRDAHIFLTAWRLRF